MDPDDIIQLLDTWQRLPCAQDSYQYNNGDMAQSSCSMIEDHRVNVPLTASAGAVSCSKITRVVIALFFGLSGSYYNILELEWLKSFSFDAKASLLGMLGSLLFSAQAFHWIIEINSHTIELNCQKC